MRQVTSFIFKFVLIAIFLYWAGKLSIRVCLTLSCLATILWQRSRKIVPLEFLPHEVTVVPNIPKILTTIGIISEEELEALPSHRYLAIDKNWNEGKLFKFKIRGVVLSAPKENPLVHWENSNTYGRGLRFCVPLGFLSEYPELYMDRSADGYTLGIKITSESWDKNRERLESLGFVAYNPNRDYLLGNRISILLGFIPDEVFSSFYHGCRDFTSHRAAEVAALISANGWKQKDIYSDVYSDSGMSYAGVFFDVQIRHLPKSFRHEKKPF